MRIVRERQQRCISIIAEAGCLGHEFRLHALISAPSPPMAFEPERAGSRGTAPRTPQF
jgi:hypothetical protein